MLFEAYFFKDINKKYDVFPQVKVIKKLNPELYGYEFTLTNLDKKIDFDMVKHNGLIFINLVGYHNNVLKFDEKMYLSSYKFVRTEYDNDKWQCIIQAVDLRFALQRIVLPNKLITQPITENKRTVWEELNKIMQVYAPEIAIDAELEEYTNVPCPELQFIKATLYEVLVGLFSICKLIPFVNNNNVLTFKDLSLRTAIYYDSKDWFVRDEESNSVTEYSDMLDYDIENAISNETDTETVWLAPTSDEAMVTTENYYWKLPSDVYEITKVLIRGNGISIYENNNWIELEDDNIDITNYVVSKTVYDTLKPTMAFNETGKEYKRNNLYYDGNIISGATYRDDKWLESLNDPQAILNVIKNSLYGLNFTAVKVDDYRKLMIKVFYKSELDNSRIKIVRKDVDIPINGMISNQEESYIDIINFGNQKQETVTRMGNKQLLGQGDYNYNDELINVLYKNIPDLGDIIDNNKVIVEEQIQYNEHHFIVNYILSEKYILETGYSGLNQLKRFTSIDTKNTVIRNDNFILNYKFNFDNNYVDDYLIKKILDNYNENTVGLNYHLINTLDKNDNLLQPNDKYIIMASRNKVIADSIVCQIQFEDNYKAGDRIDDSNDEFYNKAFLKQPVKYVDENGEFRVIKYFFGAGEEHKYIENQYIWTQAKDYPLAYPITQYPSQNECNKLLIYKDNREITSITLQFRIKGDNENIFVTNEFLKQTQLTETKHKALKIFARYYQYEEDFEKNKYNELSSIAIGDEISVASIEYSNKYIKLKQCVNTEGYWLVGLADANRNLLIGVNFLNTSRVNNSITLYLNRKY